MQRLVGSSFTRRVRVGSSSNPSLQKAGFKSSCQVHELCIDALCKELMAGQRTALSKAITLVESTRSDHKVLASQLLNAILTRRPHYKKTVHAYKDHKIPHSFRIGLSGAPGVGKSSFIEAFGMFLISQGHKVAVLAVDPSSSRTGGSILGDKTRMIDLSRANEAFVRPSPSRGSLGGVARNTNDAILLCEAAGYDVILVETVGVGQSETMVSEMVDMFVLLVAPGAGDELQGIKKGIVELSDLIIVNKSDGVLEAPARMAQMEYTSALKFVPPVHPLWKPRVTRVSSELKKGLNEVWDMMVEYYNILENANLLEKKRGHQRIRWMWHRITDELVSRVKQDAHVKTMLPVLEQAVFQGQVTAGQAADQVLDVFISKDNHNKDIVS